MITSRSKQQNPSAKTIPVIIRLPQQAVPHELPSGRATPRTRARVALPGRGANQRNGGLKKAPGKQADRASAFNNESDWLPNHAQNLIDHLTQWARELEAREEQLRRRALELEKQSRRIGAAGD